MAQKVWMITGASRGLGAEITKAALAAGERLSLIWEDGQGKVWVSYNSPAYLQERHGVPPDLLQNIAVAETLAAQASE